MTRYLGPVIITVAALIGAIALVWHGEDVATVGALLAAVGLFVDNRFRLADQNTTLDRIDENVNGKLDQRIRTAVREEITSMVVESRTANDPDEKSV